MDAVTICSDLRAKIINSVTVSIVSPSIYHEVMGPERLTLFFECCFKPDFSLSSFTFIKRLFNFSSQSVIMVVLPAYLRLLIFLPEILILACASSGLAFHMMYSTYKLNTQDDNIQRWHTSFPIWKQSTVPCPVLTVASWSAYRFLSSQVGWFGILISLGIFQFVVIHTVKDFSIVKEEEVDFFSGNLLLFQLPNRYWQFGLWFLCLF